jgi:N4-gp56 family major capsid protein
MGQQLFATNSLGGFLTNNALSQQLRYKAQTMQKFRQFCDIEAMAGQGRGNKVFFDKISNISTAGGTLVETDTIPKRNYTILQGTLTMTEYGNSIPFTSKVKTLADMSVPESIRTVLMNDMKVALDSAAATQFMTNDYIATITNTATTTFGSSGTKVATAGANMSDKNVRDIIDQMKKGLVPKRTNDDLYVCVASTNSIRGLYDFFEAKAQLTTLDPLYIGEVGRYYGCRFVEETNYLSNTDGSSGLYGEACFIGADAVREGLAIPEEIRVGIPADYGRDQGIAWYALLGFQQVWSQSGVLAGQADGQTRIITVDSL